MIAQKIDTVKRIDKKRINTVLLKLLTRELHDVERIITDRVDTLTIQGSPMSAVTARVHKDLIIDYLIDYSEGLKAEIKELEERLNAE